MIKRLITFFILLSFVFSGNAVKAELPELAKSCEITFSYQGKPFAPDKWTPTEKKIDDENTQVVYLSPDKKLRLTVTYRQYKDFPVTEIRPVLECVGKEETGIVENFKSLHFTCPCNSNSIKIRRVTGSRTSYTDFCHQDVQLQRRHECDWLHITSEQGRSAAAWLPYFGIDFDAMNGVELAIGWTGSWRVDMQYANNYWLTMGTLNETHFKMLPGE